MSYDAAGDITNDGKNQYLYNADGKICAVEWYDSQLHLTVMTGYIYDAEGNRVAKGAISTMNCDPSANGFTTQADYVLDQAGHQLSEFVPGQDGAMAWQHTNVYASGELIATDDTTETHFYLNDWLGTRRVQTDYEGVAEQTCASLPYGDGETCAPTPTENLFTGKERDAESGNDYFGARYYASSMGRFTSPDNGEDQDEQSPQSWNLYSYVRNNPATKTDEDGRYVNICDANGQNCRTIWDDQQYAQAQQQDSLNAPTLNQLEQSSGSMNITDANGNVVGTAQWGPNNPGIDGLANAAAASQISNQGMSAIKYFAVGSVALGTVGGLGLAAAPEIVLTTIGDLTPDIPSVLARAGSAVGNTGVRVASREVAEQAAKEWVGEGAEPIYADHGTGPQSGWKSADGTRVARFTSAETKGYINLVDRITGGNLHVRW